MRESHPYGIKDVIGDLYKSTVVFDYLRRILRYFLFCELDTASTSEICFSREVDGVTLKHLR